MEQHCKYNRTVIGIAHMMFNIAYCFRWKFSKKSSIQLVHHYSENDDLKSLSRKVARCILPNTHNSKEFRNFHFSFFTFHQFSMCTYLFFSCLGFLVFRSLDVETHSHRYSHSITNLFVRTFVRRSRSLCTRRRRCRSM